MGQGGWGLTWASASLTKFDRWTGYCLEHLCTFPRSAFIKTRFEQYSMWHAWVYVKSLPLVLMEKIKCCLWDSVAIGTVLCGVDWPSWGTMHICVQMIEIFQAHTLLRSLLYEISLYTHKHIIIAIMRNVKHGKLGGGGGYKCWRSFMCFHLVLLSLLIIYWGNVNKYCQF